MIETQVIQKYTQKCDEMLEKQLSWGCLADVPQKTILNWKRLIPSHQFGYEVRRVIDQHHEIMLRELETKSVRS